MTDIQRASLEETLEFCQKVREAGGGSALHALMPAVPTDPNACLIARNLNFDCSVACFEGAAWEMAVSDREIQKKIAEALDLKFNEASIEDDNGDEVWLITLPPEIGKVASDFDKVDEVADSFTYLIEDWKLEGNSDSPMPIEELKVRYGSDKFDSAYALLQEMWPYISESVKEAEHYGVFNEKGELIL